MHIDILGIVEETIHLKSWKIPWVLFRKQGGKLQRQHQGEKDDFCSFSLALVFFGMVANVWCSFFSSRPFYPQSRSVVYSVFLACNYIAEHGQLGTQCLKITEKVSFNIASEAS